MKYLMPLLFSLLLLSCADSGEGSGEFLSIEKTDSLIAYQISPSNLEFLCGQRPDETDKDIFMCVAGTWTEKLLDTFSHENVASYHVSGGVLYNGYVEPRNTGCFIWYDKNFQFAYGRDEQVDVLGIASKNNGMGFCQEMMIHNGKRVPTKRMDDNENLFRALCQKDSSLYVLDARFNESFGSFIKQLLNYGVTEALYLDMGPGWNYSWYRDGNGDLHHIHAKKNKYSTNWLEFRKKSK